jgi:methionyl-tRNA formyltransferase
MRVVFMGSSSASAECLRAILREESLNVVGVVTQPDRPAGRGKALTPCPCAQFAASHGITEIIKPDNVNAEEPMARIRAWDPDVIAVVAYGQILRKPLLELPLFGCVNCHFSLLPKYRGAAPVIATLLAGDRMTGVTVMHMGERLDDGPIMLQRYEPIYPDTTAGMLMADLSVAGGMALAKALKLLSSNALPPEVPQDEESATYVKKLKKSDGLIDWNLPALEIERKIRAYCPWPGCFTFLPERMRKKGGTGRVMVRRARFAKLSSLNPGWNECAPGTVLMLERTGPVVKCLDTALILTELKPEGGKVMDGGAFLRGRQLRVLEDRLMLQ